MDLRFWTDPETGWPHIFNHGVNEEGSAAGVKSAGARGAGR